MRILLTLMMFYPMLVSANQKEQMVVVGHCVYFSGKSVCFHGDSYINDDGFRFNVHPESNEYNLKGEEDATRTR